MKNIPIDTKKFYIDGQWVNPINAGNAGEKAGVLDVINPATEQAFAQISMGSKSDVDVAVAAANKALPAWKKTSKAERKALLVSLLAQYEENYELIAQSISYEMGAPITMAREQHAASGLFHLKNFIEEFDNFQFEHPFHGDASQLIAYEPIGVCGLITPWNWPINQLSLKIIPALAVGCTVVLKPSEIAPLSAMILADLIDKAGYPAGVFNLVHGNGMEVGSAISNHTGINMVSFTGSTNAGIAVMKSAADSVKKVTLELGGKSPNVVFADANLESAVNAGTGNCFGNTGQTCVAPTRMIVERSVYEQAIAIAKTTAETTKVGLPTEEGDHMGPLSSQAQFDKVQAMIQVGIDEGATLVAGGLGKPEGFSEGYYVRPTVFANVHNGMRIAQEEIFGPVLCIIPFDNEDEAIAIANDTPFGLNARVQTQDMKKAQRVARQLDAGMVQINGASLASGTPFGGFKQSGIGREGGKWGLEDYLEVKAISGWSQK